MDPESVIHLGHKAKQPLIRPTSELTDGLEPHDHIYSAVHHCTRTYGDQRHVGRGVPGVGWVGAGEGYYPPTQPEARLRLI